MFDAEIACPAGDPVAEAMGGTACRCRIVHETVDAKSNPSSLANYCMSAYTECPIWRDMREAESDRRAKALRGHLNTEAREAGEPV